MAPTLESVRILAQNEPQIFLEASNVLIRIINNILKDPGNEKYRKMRIANPTLSTKLLPVDGAFQCLFEMGFEEADEFLELPQQTPLDHLRRVQIELQAEIDRIQKPQARQPSGSASTPTVVSTPPATASVNRPPSVRDTMAILQSEAKFFARLQSSLSQVMMYEEPAKQEKARRAIPVAELQLKAKQKMETLKASTGGPDMRDLLLLELLAWFKKDFFQWVNQPKCVRCNGSTASSGMAEPTQEELRYGAHRVENYRCQSCGAYTRFPRYNDPGKLLETRKGRCGEWANCFTLCCRSLGFDSRYVLDWTDHVWTEVFSESQDRWLHCDPCENACDKPLVYEVGWNKKLSYIMAFSKDDIQDVAWRYSCSHKELLSRRKECRESWLLQTILKIRKQRQEKLDEQRKKQLQDRLLKEIVEFLTVKKAGESETQGRLSGSAAWRIARGEIGDISKLSTAKKVINPTPQEVSAKVLHLQYCCASDTYTRVSDKSSKTQGWQNMVYECENVFRKEENDWNMVYLARTEGTNEASISWKFEFKNVVVDRVEVKAESKCYENGRISWRVCSGEQCAILPPDGKHTVLEDLAGGDSLTLTANLSQGKGDVAWQHTQLFRQGLDDSTSPFDIKIYLKSTS